MGGGDAAINPRLRLAMDKAGDANMPRTRFWMHQARHGQLDGVDYEEIRYEAMALRARL